MMLYELINPSDPYTFEAKDRETAALAVFLLSTSYGAHCLTEEREENDVPVFLFGGSKEWYQDTFKRTPDEGLAILKEDVRERLNSFVLGNEHDRQIYQHAVDNIKGARKRTEFIKLWDDRHSSLNDIGDIVFKTASNL